jgi:hypothetical protein
MLNQWQIRAVNFGLGRNLAGRTRRVQMRRGAYEILKNPGNTYHPLLR